MRRRTTRVVACVLSGLLVGCTGGRESADPAPSRTSASPSPSTGDPTPEDGESPERTQPLAVISNVHRPRLSLTLAEARALAAGRARPALDAIRRRTGERVTLYAGSGDPVAAVERAPSAIAMVPAASVRPTVQTALVDGADPLVAPRAYPLRIGASRPAPVVTTLTFVGDIMLARGVARVNPRDPAAALRAYAPRLRAADLAVGNLESTLSDNGRPQQGADSFAASPRVVPGLKRTGFDLVTLANNHTGDFGPRALDETVARLDAGRIAHVGAGRNAAAARAPAIVVRHGLAFGFLAFNAIGETPHATADTPGAVQVRMQPRLGPLNQRDLARLTSAVARLAERVDVVTVLPHWGTQYSHVAVPDQRRVARALIDAGAHLVVGSHPHWVQGLSERRGGVVAYSLGNFVFDMDFSRQTMEGITLDVTLWGDRVMAATPAPYVLDDRFHPHPALGTRGLRVLDDVWRSSFGQFRGRQLLPHG